MRTSLSSRRHPRRPGLLGLAALAAWAPAPVRAQTQVPPCVEQVKGRVVSVAAGGASITIERLGANQIHPVKVPAEVRDLKPNDEVRLKLDCKVKPPPVIGVLDRKRSTPTPRSSGDGTSVQPNLTPVLVSSADACQLTVDFKAAATLSAGGRTELKLSSGEHVLEASTPDGRTWKEKIKVGSDQMIVEVKLGAPVATLAQYDAQAAKVVGALDALKVAGPALAEILKNKKFKFEKADAVAIVSAAASWTRELGVLKAMVAPPQRAQVTTDLASLDKDVLEYASLMEKALEAAQKNFSVLGEANTLRGRAEAVLPLLNVPAPSLAVLQASTDFKKALPAR